MDLLKKRPKIHISDCYQLHRNNDTIVVKVEFLICEEVERNFVTLTFDRLCYEHVNSEFEQSFTKDEEEFILEKLLNYNRTKKLLYTIVRPDGKKQKAKVLDAKVNYPIGAINKARVDYRIEGEQLLFSCDFYWNGCVIQKKAMHYMLPNLYTYTNGQKDTADLDTQIIEILKRNQEQLVCKETLKKVKQGTKRRLGIELLSENELAKIFDSYRLEE